MYMKLSTSSLIGWRKLRHCFSGWAFWRCSRPCPRGSVHPCLHACCVLSKTRRPFFYRMPHSRQSLSVGPCSNCFLFSRREPKVFPSLKASGYRKDGMSKRTIRNFCFVSLIAGNVRSEKKRPSVKQAREHDQLFGREVEISANWKCPQVYLCSQLQKYLLRIW